MIPVYQCELDREIPLEYIGTVIYIGPYDPLSFTNGKDYAIVRDDNGWLKVVDDTEEDYIYDLSEPNTRGGKFYYLDDPQGILKDLMNAYKAPDREDRRALEVNEMTVKEVIDRWDPYDLLAFAPSDEYSKEIRRIEDDLSTPANREPEALANRLSTLFDEEDIVPEKRTFFETAESILSAHHKKTERSKTDE